MKVDEPEAAYHKRVMTQEEYLAFEDVSEQKHEYYHGEVFAMAAAGNTHNEIFSNLFGTLAFLLKGKPCRPYGSDKRLKIPENTFYTYPDISNYCNQTAPFIPYNKVSQEPDSMAVECFRLNSSNHWELEEYKSIDQILSIPSLGVPIPLREIYEHTHLV